MPGLIISLTPLTADLHDQVVDLHAHWKRTPPDRMPPHSIVMTVPIGMDIPRYDAGKGPTVVVAACYLYPAGPFLLMEFYVTSPAFPARTRWAASVAGAVSALGIAASQGRLLLAAARTKGIECVLARAGFRDTRATIWACKVPPQPVWQELVPPPADAPAGGAVTVTKSSPKDNPTPGAKDEPEAEPRVRARKKSVKKKTTRRKVVGRRKKRSGLG